MYRHIVCFALKQSQKDKANEAKQKLLSLTSIPEVKNIEVGLDEKKGGRSFEIALIVDFDSEHDCEVYDKHELHQSVREFMRSIMESAVSVDFYRD